MQRRDEIEDAGDDGAAGLVDAVEDARIFVEHIPSVGEGEEIIARREDDLLVFRLGCRSVAAERGDEAAAGEEAPALAAHRDRGKERRGVAIERLRHHFRDPLNAGAGVISDGGGDVDEEAPGFDAAGERRSARRRRRRRCRRDADVVAAT
ncbi:hypothetical protein [Methylosinus trichosporium]|uniref:hypothetical protein n=1 Tax=Methylosinus trichosporium TaxID=426 RepID=UPI0024B969F0|nr:hypothetical protein [Methylosinus trichosporium]